MGQKSTAQQINAPKASTPVSGMILRPRCDWGSHAMAGEEWKGWGNEKPKLQRKATDLSELKEVPPIVNDVLRSPGQPLDGNTRAFFEPRFGHDFSHVRVHTDARAAESTRAVNALAYTVGSHVAVRSERHEPGTTTGRRLLAHELAHVVQQSAGVGGGDPESRADVAADSVMSGQQVNPASVGSAPVGLHRQSAGGDDDWAPKLQSIKSQLESISLTSAIKSSQQRKGIIPPIPADSPLLGDAAKSFSMRSPQTEHPIDLDLPAGKPDKKPGLGFNLGPGLRVYGDKTEESKDPGASPALGEAEGQEDLPFLQERLNAALESISIVLSWTIGGRKKKRLEQ